MLQIEFVKQKILLYEKNVKLNESIYKATKARYDNGVDDLTRVNEVLTALRVSQLNLSSSKVELFQQQEKLKAALGINLK